MQNTYKVGEALVRGRRRNQETAMSAEIDTGEAQPASAANTSAQEPTVAVVAAHGETLPTVADLLAPMNSVGGTRELGLEVEGLELTASSSGTERNVSLKVGKLSLSCKQQAK